ncbi:hypothetical protein JOE11_005016 [Robbsia andropogonis]|uniref:hypothetical protein n=1 Tax=Robbsia andropogonis TaxID=28092 RepID=UPI003D1D862D
MMNDELNNGAVPTPRRRRKAVAAPGDGGPSLKLSSIEERQFHVALESPDVRAALHEYECALAKRDSISRKLCGGSSHVTVADLAHWEGALSKTKAAIAELAKRAPILERHPTFAAVVPHS